MKLVLSLAFVLAACGSKKPTDTPTNTNTEVAPTEGSNAEGAATPMTPEACTGQGGEVRGDIGDGKVACAAGETTLGRVNQGIEGAVCCKPAAP